MSNRKTNPLDPQIRTKHAIAFFNGVQLSLASTIGTYASRISQMLKDEPNGYLQPLHAHRLCVACPEIVKFCAELEKVEVGQLNEVG